MGFYLRFTDLTQWIETQNSSQELFEETAGHRCLSKLKAELGADRTEWRSKNKQTACTLLPKLTLSLPCLPLCHSENDQQKCQIWNHSGFSTPLHEHVKGILSKYTVWTANLLLGHHIYYLQTCMCALCSPETVTGSGSDGVKRKKKEKKRGSLGL